MNIDSQEASVATDNLKKSLALEGSSVVSGESSSFKSTG